MINSLTRAINLLSAALGGSGRHAVDRLRLLYSHMSDDELRAEFRRTTAPDARPPHSTKSIARRILSRKESNNLHALAIAVLMFERHPCDLPSGSTPYTEQIEAAVLLTTGVNVQMDTGEGKTYAIAIAAAALLAEHPTVVVLTANKYLARRDHLRVEPLFSALEVELTTEVPADGFRGVAYVTLSDLCFGYLFRTYDLDGGRDRYPVKAAVVIDEMDSVLLDQGLYHVLIRRMAGGAAPWKEIFNLVEPWGADEYEYAPVTSEIVLTSRAWERVVELSVALGKPAALLLNLAAAALWSLQAQPEQHYRIVNGRVELINTITGEGFLTTSAESQALEYRLFGRSPPVGIALAEVEGLSLLQRHPLIVGTSGTMREETIYFLQQLQTLTALIPPRFRRHHARHEVFLSPSRQETFEYIGRRIEEVGCRPVVIGTWSPNQALGLAEYLEASGLDPHRLGVVAKFDSDTDNSVLQSAGLSSRVTVLSQGGSRGVDIRSTENPLLIIVGSAIEPRLDRQFLGRVGRHGERFEAEFVLDPDSPLWSPPLALFARAFGEVTPIPRAGLRGLRSLQRQAWSARARRRLRSSILTRAEAQIEQQIAGCFERARDAVGTPQFVMDVCADAFRLADEASATDSSTRVKPLDPATRSETLIAVSEAALRRARSDVFVTQFEHAVTRVLHDMYRDEPFKYFASTTGKPVEIAELTAWLEYEASRWPVQDGDGELVSSEVDQLVRSQALVASGQRLPAPTNPNIRSPVDIVEETLLLANATLLEQVRLKLESLSISGARDVYHRRAVFAIRNLHQRSRLAVASDMVKNLRQVDRPHDLDDLFFLHDAALPPARTRDEPPPAQTLPPEVRHQENIDNRIAEFLDGPTSQSLATALSRSHARLVLLSLSRQLGGPRSNITEPELSGHVKLFIDGLAASGARGSELREDERLIAAYLNHLLEKGVISAPFRPRARVKRALSRIRRFVMTIPPAAAFAVAAFVALVIVGYLPRLDPTRKPPGLEAAVAILGYGTGSMGRPLLLFLAVLLVVVGVRRAINLQAPTWLIAPLAPPLAAVTAFALYWRGISTTPKVIGLMAALAAWALLLIAAQRFVATFAGTDPILLVAASSVAAYIARELANGDALELGPVLIGALAVVFAGPRVRVSGDSSRHQAVTAGSSRSSVLVPIDSAVASALGGLAAATICAGAPVGIIAGAFVLGQSVSFAALAAHRLRLDRVEGTLARLRVGSAIPYEQLGAQLRRSAVIRTFVGAVALAVAVVLASIRHPVQVRNVFLQEWAGMFLILGVLASINALSVSGVSSALPTPTNQDSITEVVRDRIRSVRRSSRWRIVRVPLFAAALARPILWILDVFDVLNSLRRVWDFVFR